MKHFTKIAGEVSKNEILEMLELSENLQNEKLQKGFLPPLLKGKNLVMIFEKPSLRTHAAFQIAMADLGGNSLFFGPNDIFIDAENSERESIYDVVKNLEKFGDCIAARVFAHETIETMAAVSQVPVINLLCDQFHPTQALCDIYAIKKHFGNLKNLKIAFVGDGNNVAESLAEICEILEIEFAIASPSNYAIKNSAVAKFTDPKKAVKNANVIYTDTWISMGQEKEKAARKKIFQNFTVDEKLFSHAAKNSIFMHCLPAHRDYEVASEIIDGPKSIVFDQAVSRLFIARALLVKLLKQNGN
jgi:ornithine carbamoyltransferase